MGQGHCLKICWLLWCHEYYSGLVKGNILNIISQIFSLHHGSSYCKLFHDQEICKMPHKVTQGLFLAKMNETFSVAAKIYWFVQFSGQCLPCSVLQCRSLWLPRWCYTIVKCGHHVIVAPHTRVVSNCSSHFYQVTHNIKTQIHEWEWIKMQR